MVELDVLLTSLLAEVDQWLAMYRDPETPEATRAEIVTGCRNLYVELLAVERAHNERAE